MTECIALVSAGLDSFIGYDYLKESYKKVHPVFINYHTKACEKEYEIAKKMYPDLVTVKYSFNFNGLQNGEADFIYGRNIYFITFASGLCKHIALFGHMNSTNSDCSDLFLFHITNLLNGMNNSKDYWVFTPWFNKEKEDIIDWYIDKYKEDGFKTLLKLTSCYHETEHRCMRCSKCFSYYCSMFEHIKKYDAFNEVSFKNNAMIREKFEKRYNEQLRRSKSIEKVYNYHILGGK